MKLVKMGRVALVAAACGGAPKPSPASAPVGSIKLCLNAQGIITTMQMLRSTGLPAVDAKFRTRFAKNGIIGLSW